ncbi:MAG: DUF2935 domain-containing protein, partial [Bacilli bacterium]|nr:DUF2935 domain-containing protein [Bacilli bacterium]
MNTNEIISFWANIMKEHADFIVTNLAYNETDYIRGGLFYKEQFTTIANEVPNQLTNDYLERLTALITSFIEYKNSIINRLLTCKILFGFIPNFINHMIN